MSARSLLWLAAVAIMALVLTNLIAVLTAANSVSPTKAEDDNRPITANNLKPPECAAITLTSKVSGSGTITGTNSSELITGSGIADTIRGRGGSDCILGGAGSDSFDGGGGTDVCIGGPDTDTFTACETVIQ